MKHALVKRNWIGIEPIRKVIVQASKLHRTPWKHRADSKEVRRRRNSFDRYKNLEEIESNCAIFGVY